MTDRSEKKKKEKTRKLEMRARYSLFCQIGDARLPSSTCANIMAALLRLGAGRACRLLAANAIRNPSIYQRNLAILHKEHILKACIPRFSALRYLSSESTASEAVEETAEIERNSVTKDLKEFQNAREKRSNAPVTRYDRDKRQLGTIIVKKILLRTFESILQNGEILMSHRGL